MQQHRVIDQLEADYEAILERFKEVLDDFGIDGVEVSGIEVVKSEPGLSAAKSMLERECPNGQQPHWRCEPIPGGGARCGWRCE